MKLKIILTLSFFFTCGFVQSQNSQLTAEEKAEAQRLIQQMEQQVRELDIEIENTDRMIKEHESAIKDIDDTVKSIDQTIDSVYLTEIPLLEAPKQTSKQQQMLARANYINDQFSWWKNNSFRPQLQHPIFKSFLKVKLNHTDQSLSALSQQESLNLWNAFVEGQRLAVVDKLSSSHLEAHEIATHHIFQAWDDSIREYVNHNALNTSKKIYLNPGFSLSNYQNKTRYNKKD